MENGEERRGEECEAEGVAKRLVRPLVSHGGRRSKTGRRHLSKTCGGAGTGRRKKRKRMKKRNKGMKNYNYKREAKRSVLVIKLT